MACVRRFKTLVHCVVVGGLLLVPGGLASAYQAAPATKAPATKAPAAKAPATKSSTPAARISRTPTKSARSQTKYRELAPGIMTKVDPARQLDEEFSRHDVIEVLASDPNFAERDWSQGMSPAKNTRFERDIWTLEFAFKPVRFVHIDVPTPDGRLQPKLVWYLVYSITNPGDKPVAFVPRIVLVGKDTGKVYPDRLIPLATPLIRKREDPNRTLLNTVEITGKIAPTPKGQPPQVWGVATWEDIDPSTDYFAIYIQGLTNAYLWEDPPGLFQKGDPPGKGREFYPKTLMLNFWRPSDKENEHEDEIRFEGYSWHYGQLTPQGFIVKKPDPGPPPPQNNEPAEPEQ